MPNTINTNPVALAAQRALERNEADLATSLKRLSSGLRVNSAKDDAAGLAIAERMQAQVRGDRQAARNASDAVSAFQVADGALGQMTQLLERVRDLAVQSANLSNSAADVQALNAEMQINLDEADRIATGTQFNGQHLLDGTLTAMGFQLGANAGDVVNVTSSVNTRRTSLGVLQRLQTGDLRVANGGSGGAFAFGGTYTSQPIANMDFSLPAVPFSGGSATSGGTPAFDYSGGQTAVIAVDGANVTLNANYGSLAGVTAAVQNGLNAVHAGWYQVTNDGSNLTITKTASAASPTAAVGIAAVSGANAAVFAAGTQTAGTAFQATTHAGVSVDGIPVLITTNYTGNDAGLVADIQGQLDAGPSGPGVYTVSGGAAGVSIQKNGVGASPPVVAYSSGRNAFLPAPPSTLTLAAGDLTLVAQGQPAVDITGSFATANALVQAINRNVNGVYASVNASTGVLQITSTQALTVSGAQAMTTLAFSSANSSSFGTLANVDVVDDVSASTTIQRMDAALITVNSLRGNFGALQNRFEYEIANLQSQADNLAAARGRIMDADYAAETAALARTQILQRAGLAVIAQANQSARTVLSLLL
jgi:flagellin